MTKQSPILHKPLSVNVADARDEGGCSYLGRSHKHRWLLPGVDEKVCCEKSAEAIVPCKGEGLNEREVFGK
jgi:hypothetical protein